MTTSGLPETWAVSPLGHLGVWNGGGTPTKSNPAFWKGDIPWASPKDIKVARLWDSSDHVSTAAIEASATTVVPKGSVLVVTRSGILSHTLPIATNEVPLAINQDLKAITPFPGIDADYLAWTLRALERRILKECSKHGTTVHSVEVPRLQAFDVPVAPPQEQRRIVAKIEELFSELDKGVESLKTARRQLDVYRQSVLKHAFEGTLTAQWRGENKDKLETPEQLLARIKQERMAGYERLLQEWRETVKKWEAKGQRDRKPPKPRRPRNAESVVVVAARNPFWAQLLLDELALESVLGKMLDKEKNKGVARFYLGNVDVRWGKFDGDNLKTMRVEDSEIQRYGLARTDLVICEGGEPGRCAVWEGPEYTTFIQKALHRVRFTESYSPYFAYYFMRYAASSGLLSLHFTGSTIKHLTGRGLRNLLFPLCTLAEQQQIVHYLDRTFDFCDELDRQLEHQVRRTAYLRQSVLYRAFSGQLVAPDPSDEPASVLLDRIKAETEKIGKGGETAAKTGKKRPAS